MQKQTLMVNTRGKIKKDQNAIKTCFSHASMGDPDQQSTESGSLIGSNDDLLTEILIRLPVTSILRFKSVSKHWRSLLSQSHFTLRFDSLSKSPGLFTRDTYIPFDVENRNTPPFRSLDFYINASGIFIVQSCNGLLLCCSLGCKSGSRKYYVFNPTTKQLAIIPFLPGGQKVRKTVCFMSLAFHQTDCVHFKVVCIRCLEGLFQIQTYSSDTRKWKISIESFYANQSNFNNGVYWNGAIHWAQDFDNQLYFKLDTEQLLTLPTLPLPVGITPMEMLAMYIGESRGHLHLILFNYNSSYLNVYDYDKLHLNVYEMSSDHSGWFVRYQVKLDQLPGAFPEMVGLDGYKFRVIDVVRGVKEEDTFVVLIIPDKLIKYNVHDKSFKHIFSLRLGGQGFHRYTETLASF